MYLQVTLIVCTIVNFHYAHLINDSQNKKEDIHACVGRLLHVKNLSDVTVVNVQDNDVLAKILYGGTTPRLIINRSYLSSDLMIYNKAYVIYSTKYEELIAGMTNLTKDVYWNPRVSIIIAIEKINETAIKEAFQYLNFLNAFHSSIVTQTNDDKIYVYQNVDSNNELTKVYCENKTSINKLKLVKHFEDNFYNMTFIVNDIAPYTFVQNDSENKPIGFDEIFWNIANEFSNITITPRFNINYSTSGIVFNNFTVAGPLKQVQMGEVDGISGHVILNENRVKMFDFVHTRFSDNLVYVVPKSKTLKKWQAMFLIFKVPTWLIISLIYAVFSLLAFKTNLFQRHSRYSMFLICLGYFLSNVPKLRTKSKSKWIITFWALVTWLLSCCYQTQLSSVFTEPITTHQVDSVDEIVEQNFQMYINKQYYPLLNMPKAFKIYDIFQNTIVTDSPTKSLQSVAKGGKKVAVISRIIYENFEVFFRDCHGRPKLHLMKDTFAHMWLTTLLKRGNRHLKKLRKLELQTIEAGILNKIVQDNEFRQKIKYQVKSRSEFQPIKFDDIRGLYFALLIGCLSSILVWLLEIYAAYKSFEKPKKCVVK